MTHGLLEGFTDPHLTDAQVTELVQARDRKCHGQGGLSANLSNNVSCPHAEVKESLPHRPHRPHPRQHSPPRLLHDITSGGKAELQLSRPNSADACGAEGKRCSVGAKPGLCPQVSPVSASRPSGTPCCAGVPSLSLSTPASLCFCVLFFFSHIELYLPHGNYFEN